MSSTKPPTPTRSASAFLRPSTAKPETGRPKNRNWEPATTAEAKAAETKRIQDHVNKTGEVPPGNRKSFPQPEPPPPPKPKE